MTPQSRRLAGILLVLIPTVEIGGASLLYMLVNEQGYQAHALRQELRF